MSVEVVLKNVFNGTGEGPHWDPETKTLYMVDLTSPQHPHGRLLIWDGTTVECHTFENQCISSVIPTSRDREKEFIITLDQTAGLYHRQSKEFTKLAEVDEGKSTRFNDAKCDARGRLVAGTMSLEKEPGVTEELHVGTLYSFSETSGVQELVKGVTISNGIAWSGDLSRMYYVDSEPRRVYVYQYDIDRGTVSEGKIFKDFSQLSLEEYGFPDGCCMDNNDNLWLALYNAGKVVCLNSENGDIIHEILFPAKRITSVCFGGEDFTDLYVTSGVYGLSEEEFVNEQPLAGSLFKVTQLNVAGLPPSCFTRET